MTHKTFFYIVSLIFFLVFVYSLSFGAPKNFPTKSLINVKEGASLRSISKDLEMRNVIRSRVMFETFAIILGGEKNVAFGDYFFENKLPVFEVARRLVNGERHLARIKVTIPEGFNINEISEVFVLNLTNFNADKFLLEAKTYEGYLFPDTYFFLTGGDEEDVLRSMSDNFEKKMTPIRPEIISLNKAEKEIITMASLIEEESRGDIDRAIISGILWKRIAIGMPLQVDAERDTYENIGLPENPISNPGMASIMAAINPQKSPYLYYLHDKEGNIHYASNFEDHKLNKQKYLK